MARVTELTQADIVLRRKEAERAVRLAEGDLLIAKARLKAVRALCEHPNAYVSTLYDGSTERRCLDCGLAE